MPVRPAALDDRRYHGYRVPAPFWHHTLAAQIICDTYQDHLPHYRQSQRFQRRHDIDIRRQTLNTWTPPTARHLASIVQAIRGEILRADELQDDESPSSSCFTFRAFITSKSPHRK